METLTKDHRASFTSASTLLPLVLDVRVVTDVGGGPEKTILNSPRFLPELGYRAICVYLHPPDDDGFKSIRQRAAEASAELYEIDDAGPFDFSVFHRALNLCRELNAVIWHGHDYKSNLIGLWVRRHWPIKLVTTVHGWVRHTWRTPLYYAIDRCCLSRYDRVICVSDDLYRSCLQSNVRPQACELIENAIDTEQFRRRCSVPIAKQRLGLDPQRRLIGAVGRLSPEKGFDVLIAAVKRLHEEGCNADLVILGEGDDRPRLESQLAALGLQNHVRLLGYQSDAHSYYEAFDVFALSSFREGLPNVVLEAMALETPVVSTEVAGVPNVIANGQNGLLVPPGNVLAMAGALRRVLADDDLRHHLAAKGRTIIEQRFCFQRRMEKIACVYDALLYS